MKTKTLLIVLAVAGVVLLVSQGGLAQGVRFVNMPMASPFWGTRVHSSNPWNQAMVSLPQFRHPGFPRHLQALHPRSSSLDAGLQLADHLWNPFDSLFGDPFFDNIHDPWQCHRCGGGAGNMNNGNEQQGVASDGYQTHQENSDRREGQCGCSHGSDATRGSHSDHHANREYDTRGNQAGRVNNRDRLPEEHNMGHGNQQRNCQQCGMAQNNDCTNTDSVRANQLRHTTGQHGHNPENRDNQHLNQPPQRDSQPAQHPQHKASQHLNQPQHRNSQQVNQPQYINSQQVNQPQYRDSQQVNQPQPQHRDSQQINQPPQFKASQHVPHQRASQHVNPPPSRDHTAHTSRQQEKQSQWVNDRHQPIRQRGTHLGRPSEVASLQLKGYHPSEISVRTEGHKIRIQGKQVCGCEDTCVAREFERSYSLPDNIDSTTLKASLRGDGVLRLEGIQYRHTVGTVDTTVPIEGDGQEQVKKNTENCLSRKPGMKLGQVDKRTGKPYVAEQYETVTPKQGYVYSEGDEDVTLEVVDY